MSLILTLMTYQMKKNLKMEI